MEKGTKGLMLFILIIWFNLLIFLGLMGNFWIGEIGKKLDVQNDTLNKIYLLQHGNTYTAQELENMGFHNLNQ